MTEIKKKVKAFCHILCVCVHAQDTQKKKTLKKIKTHKWQSGKLKHFIRNFNLRLLRGHHESYVNGSKPVSTQYAYVN